MTQAHEVLASGAAVAAAGVALGLAGIAALMLARGQRPGRAAATTPDAGLVPQAYRYCPTEQRTRAAVLHPDGSATCGDCGAHIPAGES